MACLCPPANNRSCATQGNFNQDNISIAQPTCVILPDNTTENNPFFDTANSISYWAYKIVVGCNIVDLLTPVAIYIPIYENIEAQNITVSERILSCGRFEDITFDFATPTGITPPEGFRYLRIQVDDRYSRGVSVYYRLAIMGNFPESEQTLYVEDDDGNVLSFTDSFVVPGEPLTPNITVTKNAEVVIDGSQATINYTVDIINTGNTDLTNINYTDIINYDGANITIGTITVNPDTITVDTSVSGVIRLSGNIGDLTMGEMFEITYSVPITNFATPNTYAFTSITTATSGDTQGSANTSVMIPVVEFATMSTCNVPDSDSGEFTVLIMSVPNSPAADLVIVSLLTVPADVTVQFTSFNGCMALFDGTQTPVELNTDVTDSVVEITCDITVEPNATVASTYSFNVISTSAVDRLSMITNRLDMVSLSEANSQVFLGASPLPNEATIDVGSDAECTDPCS